MELPNINYCKPLKPERLKLLPDTSNLILKQCIIKKIPVQSGHNLIISIGLLKQYRTKYKFIRYLYWQSKFDYQNTIRSHYIHFIIIIL